MFLPASIVEKITEWAREFQDAAARQYHMDALVMGVLKCRRNLTEGRPERFRFQSFGYSCDKCRVRLRAPEMQSCWCAPMTWSQCAIATMVRERKIRRNNMLAIEEEA